MSTGSVEHADNLQGPQPSVSDADLVRFICLLGVWLLCAMARISVPYRLTTGGLGEEEGMPKDVGGAPGGMPIGGKGSAPHG